MKKEMYNLLSSNNWVLKDIGKIEKNEYNYFWVYEPLGLRLFVYDYYEKDKVSSTFININSRIKKVQDQIKDKKLLYQTQIKKINIIQQEIKKIINGVEKIIKKNNITDIFIKANNKNILDHHYFSNEILDYFFYFEDEQRYYLINLPNDFGIEFLKYQNIYEDIIINDFFICYQIINSVNDNLLNQEIRFYSKPRARNLNYVYCSIFNGDKRIETNNPKKIIENIKKHVENAKKINNLVKKQKERANIINDIFKQIEEDSFISSRYNIIRNDLNGKITLYATSSFKNNKYWNPNNIDIRVIFDDNEIWLEASGLGMFKNPLSFIKTLRILWSSVIIN
jgi:hypothetical protein